MEDYWGSRESHVWCRFAVALVCLGLWSHEEWYREGKEFYQCRGR
jgi:hypothetical protein